MQTVETIRMQLEALGRRTQAHQLHN